MSNVTLSLPDNIKSKLSKVDGQSDLVRRLLKKHFNEELEVPLRVLELNECDSCGTNKGIYVCEKAHGTMYCRRCLIKTENVGLYGKFFIAKCLRGDCSFIPLNMVRDEK